MDRYLGGIGGYKCTGSLSPFCALGRERLLTTVLFPDLAPESSSVQVVTISHLEVASGQNQFVPRSPEYPGRELEKSYARPLTQQRRRMTGCFCASGSFLLCQG